MYIYIYIHIIYIRYRRDMRRVLDVPMGEIEIFPYIWNRSPMPSEWRHRPVIDHLRSPSAPYLHLCPPPTPPPLHFLSIKSPLVHIHHPSLGRSTPSTPISFVHLSRFQLSSVHPPPHFLSLKSPLMHMHKPLSRSTPPIDILISFIPIRRALLRLQLKNYEGRTTADYLRVHDTWRYVHTHACDHTAMY